MRLDHMTEFMTKDHLLVLLQVIKLFKMWIVMVFANLQDEVHCFIPTFCDLFNLSSGRGDLAGRLDSLEYST